MLKAKTQAMVEFYLNKNQEKPTFHGGILPSCTLQDAEEREGYDNFIFHLAVPECMTNKFGEIHRGALAAAVDLLTSISIRSTIGHHIVSVDLSVNYIQLIPQQCQLILDIQVYKAVESTVTCTATILEETRVLAKAAHTTFIVSRPQ